jgi:hypothetical protein
LNPQQNLNIFLLTYVQDGDIETKKLLTLTSEANNITVKNNDNGVQNKNKYPIVELSKFEQNAFIKGMYLCVYSFMYTYVYRCIYVFM